MCCLRDGLNAKQKFQGLAIFEAAKHYQKILMIKKILNENRWLKAIKIKNKDLMIFVKDRDGNTKKNRSNILILGQSKT